MSYALLAILLSSHLSGDVSLDLKTATLSATLHEDYVALDDATSIELLIGKSFDVRKAACRICGAFRVDKSDDPATLHIDLKEPLAKGAHVPLTIEYGGSIAGAFHRDVEFLELGLDDFWYPVNPRIGESDFTFDLNVRADAPGYELVTNGMAKKTRRGWRIVSRVADLDVDVILGTHLAHVSVGGIDIVTKDVPPERPKQLVADMRRVLDFYNSTFGASSPERAVTGVFRPLTVRQRDGGYFRKGYFVLPKLESSEGALPNIAHELAHHWWIHASARNAWLNESFAEYSAMMAMRKIRGRQAFEAMLDEKKTRVASKPLPPIYGFDRTKDRRNTPAVFYSKGPLVLNALENEVGEAKFLELLRRAADERVVDTDALIALVSRVASPAVAGDFARRLKE